MMYQGKRLKKRKLKKKPVILLVSLLCLLATAIGGTVMLLSTETKPLVNTFTATGVPISVQETFENNVKTNVRIRNDGNTDAYIRAAIVVNWKMDRSGTEVIYGGAAAPVLDQDYTMSCPADSLWVKGSDGYYYYTKMVPPDGTDETGVLLTDCKLIDGAAPPENCWLSVEILAQSIQARGGSMDGETFTPAVTQAWGIPVDADGTLNVPTT